ncbi:MAG: DNA polymerase III subunit beta [Syntrophorhabdus sp. PtaU1.Bin153]|nr:MAG: DNA polymerase III subunit beta [Syntrophorhabdus sp. PtaU1.Bin153]
MSFVIPITSMQILDSILDKTSDVEIAWELTRAESKKVIFTVYDKSGKKTRLITRVLSGRYPDIDSVIPHHEHHAVVPLNALIEGIHRVAAISANKKKVPITLEIDPAQNLLTMTMEEQEGQSSTAIELIRANLPNRLTILMYAGQMIEHLSHLDPKVTRSVVLNVAAAGYGVVHFAEDSYQHIIMPVRV